MLNRINQVIDYLVATKSRELSQSMVRLGLVLVVYLFLISYYLLSAEREFLTPFMWATICYFVFTVSFLIHIIIHPQFVSLRHYITMVLDMSLLGYGMYTGGIAAAFFYGGYLWLVMGNGLRFGRRSLYISVLLSTVSFAFVISYTPFWQQNRVLGLGLMLWLFLLPPYISKLISSKDEALKQAQLADHAKSQFLANMSHELRTPLNGIIGYAQMISEDEVEQDEVKYASEKIDKAAKHLLDLISELLDLASIEAGKMKVKREVVYLGPLLNEVMILIEASAKKRKISVDIGTIHDQPVSADRLRLKQVIANLLSNAIKYNHEGGQIRIVTSLSGSNSIVLSVCDTGPGLSEQEQAKLFMPFERLSAGSSSVEGAGIGLMITKRLVNLMHGDMGVESKKGEGSCFWVKLLLTE
ncbi:MAG: HAMP domain-containing sensor histidine kinase [Thioalkalispiraceae bacterium]|jgi:two-component system sensor histidine kinase RpfC